MARALARIPYYKKFDDQSAIVNSDALELGQMDDDFIYGLSGKMEQVHFEWWFPHSDDQNQDLHWAHICLDVPAKHVGPFNPIEDLKTMRFFGGPNERSDVQVAVGRLWQAAEKAVRIERNEDWHELGQTINFSRADEYMVKLPQHAASIAKRLGWVGLVMPMRLLEQRQFVRVMMIRRNKIFEFLEWAAFENRKGTVRVDVPGPDGDVTLELAGRPIRLSTFLPTETRVVTSPAKKENKTIPPRKSDADSAGLPA